MPVLVLRNTSSNVLVYDLTASNPVIRTLEPASVIVFRRVGAHQEHPVVRHARHGEVADQLATLVQHRRERDAADLRHAVRHHVRQPLLAAGARDVELAVVGDLDQSH